MQSEALQIARSLAAEQPSWQTAAELRRFIYLSITSWRPDIPRKDAAIAAAAAVLRQRSLQADFKESEHPRAPEGTEEGGQFVKKEGGAEGLHTNREANAVQNWSRRTGFGHGFDEQWRDDLKDVLKIKTPEAAAEYAAKARSEAASGREAADRQLAEIEELRGRLADPELSLGKRYDVIGSLKYKLHDQQFRERSIASDAAKAELGEWRQMALRGLAEGKAAKKALRRKVEGEPAFDLPLQTADAQALFADRDPDPAARAQYEAAVAAAGKVLGTAPNALTRASPTEEVDKAAAAGELDRLYDWGWVQAAVRTVVGRNTGPLEAEIAAFREAYEKWFSPGWSDSDKKSGAAAGEPPPVPPAAIRDALDPSDPSKLADGWPGRKVGLGYDDEYTPGQKKAAWDMLAKSSPEIARLREGMDRLERRANDANRTLFEKAPSFFRGVRMSEVSNMLSSGTTGTKIASNGGNDMLSLTPDASEAFTFTMTDDKTTEQGKHGLSIMVEFSGDAVRENGGAPVEYSYTAQDGPGRERFGKPITIVHAEQHETRIKKFVPLDKAGLKRFIVGIRRRDQGMTKEAQALIKKMAEHADVLLYDSSRVDYDRYYKGKETGPAESMRKSMSEEGAPVPEDRRKTIADLGALGGAIRGPDPLAALWQRAREASSSPDRTAETLAGWLAKWYYDGDLPAARRAVRRLRVGRLRGLLAAYKESEHPRDEKGRWAETEGRRSTPDELRKRIGRLRTDLRRLRKDANASPEDEARLAEALGRARRAYTVARGGSTDPEHESQFGPPPAPETAGTVWGTAGRLRPVKRGATAAIEEAASRQAAKARRVAESLVDYERIGPALGRGLPPDKRERFRADLQQEVGRYTTLSPDQIASFFEDGGSLLPDDEARLDFLLTLRSMPGYDNAPARATKAAEDEYGRMLDRQGPALVEASQRVFEQAPAFWRGTSAKELDNLARTGKWGEGQDPDDRFDFSADESTAGVATTALPDTALEYLPSDDAVLVEIDAESMRAAHDNDDNDDNGVITPKTVLGKRKPMLAAHMAPLQEARIKPGMPIDRVRPAAFHLPREVADRLTYDQKHRLEKIAPVVVHGGGGAGGSAWPDSLDPTDRTPLKGARAPPQADRPRRSRSSRRPRRRRPSADFDKADAPDGIRALAESLRDRYRAWGLGPRRAELADILRQWRPDLPTSEIVRALRQQSPKQPATVRRSASLRARLRALKGGEWDESKHPRGQPGNAGQFVETAGGSKGSKGRIRSGSEWEKPRGDREARAALQKFREDTDAGKTAWNEAVRLYNPAQKLLPYRAQMLKRIRGENKPGYLDRDSLHALSRLLAGRAAEMSPYDLRSAATAASLRSRVVDELPDDVREAAGSFDRRLEEAAHAPELEAARIQYEKTASFWRGTTIREAVNVARNGFWGLRAGTDEKARGRFVSFSASPRVAGSYTQGVIFQVDGTAFRKAANTDEDAGSPVSADDHLSDPARTPEGQRRHMAGQAESRLASGAPLDRYPITAIHVLGMTVDEYEGDNDTKNILDELGRLAPVYVHADEKSLAALDAALRPRSLAQTAARVWAVQPRLLRPPLDSAEGRALLRDRLSEWFIPSGFSQDEIDEAVEQFSLRGEPPSASLNAAARVQLVPALNRERQKYRVDWRENARKGRKKKADLFIKTFLIDDTRNRNGWRASWPSIKRLHKTFRGRPGIVFWSCGRKGCLRDHTEEQTYEANVRRQEKYRVSTIIDTVLDESTHTAYAIHHVEREDFAQQVRQGIVKFLSPSVWPDREKTTVRLADPDGTADEPDLAREWHIDTTGWKGLHDAWVDIPAYGPKARVVATCEGRKDCAAELRKPQSYGTLAARLRRIRSRLPSLRAAYEEAKHPRDEKGRWAETESRGGMDDGLSPADRAARTMHRAERVFKSVQRRSFDGENPGWPLVRPEKDAANRHFEAAARKDAVVVTQMNPHDYLRLAARLTHPVPDKIERFAKRIEAGEEIDTPYLILAEDDKHGLPQVTGHEGRHRARAAIEAGVASMPVYLYSFQPFSEGVREDLWGASIERIADEMRGQDAGQRLRR